MPIHTVEARSKLAPRRAPYWEKVYSGCQLGFRKMTATSKGTWLVQYYDQEVKKQVPRSLGAFDEFPDGRRYDEAKKAAMAFFEHVGKGGTLDVVTVHGACAAYVEHVRHEKGAQAARDIEKRFERHVSSKSTFAGIELKKLTKTRVEAWRKALASKPVQVNRDARLEPVTRPRAPSSLNRDMAALRAALNFAHDAGHVTSDLAWRVALRPIKNADGSRKLFLERAQLRALIDAAPAEFATFLRGLCLLPLRPGALAALTVGSFDKNLGVLTIGQDKGDHARKIKLPVASANLLKEVSKDKLPGARMFMRADGQPWDRHTWKKMIKAAAASAALPDDVVAYTLRHSAITELVTAGVELLTVAQISGTSVAMIERHYGHLRSEVAEAALAKLAI
jgi:integrase